MRRAEHGLTILELMVVVVIVGILAAVAVVTYKRYIRKAHASEVPLIFGELRSKQEQYGAENALFYVDEPTWYPGTATTDVDKEVAVDPAMFPAGWIALRVNLPKAAVYCDYVTRAGDGGTSPETVTDNFDGLYATPPTTNWYFVEARCNFSDDSGGTYSEYHQPGNVTQIHKNNEGM